MREVAEPAVVLVGDHGSASIGDLGEPAGARRLGTSCRMRGPLPLTF
ncbi:hypothetical protein [Streptosporangium roseum]|nr:hypothetical protein [Streptosporangium roseum]